LRGHAIVCDYPAIGTETANQSLRHNALQCGCQSAAVDSEIRESRDRAAGVISMERSKNEVAGKRGLNRNGGGLSIADLADKDDIRILSQN
jgi:hypothetical protein